MTTNEQAPRSVYDLAWHILTGRDDPWGGCAMRAEVERVAAVLAGERHRVAAETLREAAQDLANQLKPYKTLGGWGIAAAVRELIARADRIERPAVGGSTPAAEEQDQRPRVSRERLDQAHARADRWLDRAQRATDYLGPEKLRQAYEWAVAMESEDIPASMSDWLLDGLRATPAVDGEGAAEVCEACERGYGMEPQTRDLHVCMAGNENRRVAAVPDSLPLDPEPQPSDGPDYHADHAAWSTRQSRYREGAGS